jgi:hypothetical protein
MRQRITAQTADRVAPRPRVLSDFAVKIFRAMGIHLESKQTVRRLAAAGLVAVLESYRRAEKGNLNR